MKNQSTTEAQANASRKNVENGGRYASKGNKTERIEK